MTTSHGSLPPGTCHAEFLVDNKCTYLDTGPTMNQEVGGRGQIKGKSGKASQFFCYNNCMETHLPTYD